MGWIGGDVGYSMLRFIAPRSAADASSGHCDELGDVDLKTYFGPDFDRLIAGKTVIDFGCGTGWLTVELAQRGAARVIGLDIQERFLARGRQRAEGLGLSERCTFATRTDERADVIISKDSFEHFDDPGAILSIMASLVKPDGYVLIAFGWPWLHPYGGHLFSVFPWSHLLFTERAQIRWRSDFKTDGATRFSEVEGGLNQMTIARLERLVEQSPLRCESLDTVPIRGLKLLKTRLLREFGTSIVRCRLRLRT
jgi:SAM-dependent methyltransferase